MKRSFRLYMIPNLYVIVININKSHYYLTTDVFFHVAVELQLQSCRVTAVLLQLMGFLTTPW